MPLVSLPVLLQAGLRDAFQVRVVGVLPVWLQGVLLDAQRDGFQVSLLVELLPDEPQAVPRAGQGELPVPLLFPNDWPLAVPPLHAGPAREHLRASQLVQCGL